MQAASLGFRGLVFLQKCGQLLEHHMAGSVWLLFASALLKAQATRCCVLTEAALLDLQRWACSANRAASGTFAEGEVALAAGSVLTAGS
jgi:hypothetical protein